MALKQKANVLRPKVYARGGYKTVHGPDQRNRERISVEQGGEVESLPATERARLIALARNTVRNSEALEALLHQIEINAVGPECGKAVFSFPEKYSAAEKQIKSAFSKWARSAEYFSDLDLQDTLRLILRTQLVGGDLVLVFDNGITRESTGQVIAFEPDCLGNIPKAEFEKRFPGCTQHQGVIKNANGKDVGAIVSWSQRGVEEFSLYDEKGRLAVWPLMKKAGLAWTDSSFVLYRGLNRFNQIRGASRLWPGLGTIADMSHLQGYEVQAAKKNSQVIGQVTQQAEEQHEADLANELDPDAGEEIEGGLTEGEVVEDGQESLDLDAIEGAGVIYDVLPPGVKAELFDTKHPNDKLVEFMRRLNCGVGHAIGVNGLFVTGEAVASYSAAMAEMIVASRTFQDEFHKLEKGFLDWLLANWSRWAQSRGLIPMDAALPENWRFECVKWIRPSQKALNPVDEQNALNMGLKNGTILYREKLGPDWKTKLEAFGEEIEFCRAHGIPHVALQTVSGGVIETANNENKDNK